MLAVQTPLPLSPDFYATARTNMVESQLRPNRILDQGLIKAFSTVAREGFLPDDQKSFAYIDEDISVGSGRKLLAPLTLARMIQELRVGQSDRVLDIGANTGYVAAILNELAGETIALETDANLLRQLQQNKRALGLEQISALQGTLSEGFAPASPYQAILIEGAIQWLPEKITNQLVEGGRLVAIVYPQDFMPGQMGVARLYEKKHGVLGEKALFDVAAPLLPGFAARPRFEF